MGVPIPVGEPTTGLPEVYDMSATDGDEDWTVCDGVLPATATHRVGFPVVRLGTAVRLGDGTFCRALAIEPEVVLAVTQGVPLADYHGVPWAGLASVVLANKFPLADHHGARAGLASLLRKLANLYPSFLLLCAWHLTVSVGNSAVLPRSTAFRANLANSCILRPSRMLCAARLHPDFCDAERGEHIDVWCFGFGGLLRVLVVVFCGGFGVCLLWFSHLLCFTSSAETHKNGLLRC